LNAFTTVTFVLASGLKAVFIVSSHTSGELLPLPQPEAVTRAPTAPQQPQILIHRWPVLTLTRALVPVAFDLIFTAVPPPICTILHIDHEKGV
jgi:hypothetical protein